MTKDDVIEKLLLFGLIVSNILWWVGIVYLTIYLYRKIGLWSLIVPVIPALAVFLIMMSFRIKPTLISIWKQICILFGMMGLLLYFSLKFWITAPYYIIVSIKKSLTNRRK
jgi:hypothetical protein